MQRELRVRTHHANCSISTVYLTLRLAAQSVPRSNTEHQNSVVDVAHPRVLAHLQESLPN